MIINSFSISVLSFHSYLLAKHICNVCVRVCMCALCPTAVSSWQTRQHITCLSCGVTNSSTPDSDEDQEEPGVPCVGLKSQQWRYTMHTHHVMHKMVLAPGPSTQVPACYCPWPIHLSGGSSASKLVNQLLSVPQLGREGLLMEG